MSSTHLYYTYGRGKYKGSFNITTCKDTTLKENIRILAKDNDYQILPMSIPLLQKEARKRGIVLPLMFESEDGLSVGDCIDE